MFFYRLSCLLSIIVRYRCSRTLDPTHCRRIRVMTGDSNGSIPPTVGPTADSLSSFSVEALSQLAELLTPPTVHSVPTLTRQGFAKQAEFNVVVLNKLECAKRDPNAIDAIIDFIRERNNLLVMADKNPKILDMMDTARALEGASQSSSSSMLQALVLAQSLNQTNERKRRASSPPFHSQPFRYGAPAHSASGAQNHSRLPSLATTYSQYSSLPGFSQGGSTAGYRAFSSRSTGPCHNCGQYGHFRAYCTQQPARRYCHTRPIHRS